MRLTHNPKDETNEHDQQFERTTRHLLRNADEAGAQEERKQDQLVDRLEDREVIKELGATMASNFRI